MTDAEGGMLRLEEVGGVLVACILESNFVTEEDIDGLGKSLFDLVENRGHRRLALDFANVQYLSSLALGRLISLKKKLTDLDGRLRLFHVHPDLMEVFRITNLNRVFEILPDRESALRGMTD
jgi:anti-sigma B factor antagonist